MSPVPPVIDASALAQAAEWYAVLRADGSGERERSGWRRWLQASASHREAWQRIEAVASRFAPLQADGERGAAVATLQANRGAHAPGRRRALKGVASIAGGAMLGWGGWQQSLLPEWVAARSARYRTAIGETRQLQAPDGSRLWLNTASALDLEFDAAQRHVRLLRGEVLIESATDPLRPLFVSTTHGRVLALGTRFSVWQDQDDSQVTVFGGTVEIRPAAADAPTVLRAGQQARFTRRLARATAQAIRTREAWVRGVLVADGITLRELVEELDRYRPGHLDVAPAVTGLRVFGTYPLLDPQRALAMLEAALPVRLQRRLFGWVTLVPRVAVD